MYIELLERNDKDFGPFEDKFDKNEGIIKNISSIEDLYKINNPEDVKRRFSSYSQNTIHSVEFLERIIGKNHLLDISYLKKGLKMAMTVCRIIKKGTYEQPHGTGFMVGPELLMTNNHVIQSIEQAHQLSAEFEYERNANNEMLENYQFEFYPERFFITNSNLDYTVIAVKPIATNNPTKNLNEYGWNKLNASELNIINSETVNIIQHPSGKPKMIALRDNQIINITDKHIHYNADTQPGSSGSFVANDQWEIVALHNSAIPNKNEQGQIILKNGNVYQNDYDFSKISWKANQGIRMDIILEDISLVSVSTEKQKKMKSVLLSNYTSKNTYEYKIPSS